MAYKIFICNIPYSMNSLNITGLFTLYGNVIYATAIKDRDTGVPKGYGFVEMETEKGMLDAIKSLNGRIISNRKIKVSIAIDRSNSKTVNQGHIIGEGTCVMCNKHKLLSGYTPEKGICNSCATILGKTHYYHEKAKHFASTHTDDFVIECDVPQ